MAYQTLRQEYFQIPVVTRAYTTACVITTLSVHLEIVTPFQLYFNPTLILEHYQLWRLGTTFLFFGTFGFNFLFNMIFTYRKNMFDEPIEDADYTALPEDRPGGFNWGREVDNNANNEAQNNERRDGITCTLIPAMDYALIVHIETLINEKVTTEPCRLDSDPRWSKVYDPFPQATSRDVPYVDVNRRARNKWSINTSRLPNPFPCPWSAVEMGAAGNGRLPWW
ncbi:conserved hypothetical protein [Culex quinquefasciatus]|uniref:Derlin n=1 Tax=Culex quinquefasciatus TaxID=7176 RepID=B0W8G5_CULQU|nr:conserved hypothetical protein [Culex quinquefasciatus]|eukprot:XP_001844999.1 conserved hypothetical protein [Culex quinquefasciatus]